MARRKEMVNIERQENQDRQHVLKLGHQGNLVLVLRVEDIGCGKAHLVTDDRTAEFHGGKYQPRHKTNHQSQHGLLHISRARPRG